MIDTLGAVMSSYPQKVSTVLFDLQSRASAVLSALASYLSPNVTITSLSIACTTSTNTSPASNQASGWHLTITRYQGAEPPILMTIPIPSHSIHNLSDRGAEDEPPMALKHQVTLVYRFVNGTYVTC